MTSVSVSVSQNENNLYAVLLNKVRNSHVNNIFCFLQDFSGYPGTSLRIGKRMVVMLQMIATGLGDGLQLVVGQQGHQTTGGDARAMELIVGIVHLIAAEHSLQTVLVEGLVVGHQRQTVDQRLYLSPHVREERCILRVVDRQTMHPSAPVCVVVGLGLYQRVERVHDLAVSHDHHSHGAHAGALVVGRLEVYRSKVSHIIILSY